MKTVKLLELILALTLICALAMPLMAIPTPVKAGPVTSETNDIVSWYQPTGLDDANSLLTNPEYLKLVVTGKVHTFTTIIIQGQDVFGQNIEAKVVIPPYDVSSPQNIYVFNDTHTNPPKPVAFAKITGILQQNGTHGDEFEIHTCPDLPDYGLLYTFPPNMAYEEYLGQYHLITEWQPGQYYGHGGATPHTIGTYWVGNGPKAYGGKAPSLQNVQVEPSNPDPLKILINWVDANGDLFPDTATELGHAGSDAYITITGLDERGNIMNVTTHITAGQGQVSVVTPGGHTWSTICDVYGPCSSSDSFYILTEQKPQRELFVFHVRIDHITIQPGSYDLLAYPDAISGLYPGVTNITVALRDRDDNFVHAPPDGVELNLFTSGGKILPSSDILIPFCHITYTANLTADTNARTINVTALADVPQLDTSGGELIWPEEILFAYTEMTFDGINSVQNAGGVIIHAMMQGYVDTYGVHHDLLVPPKPWLPPELGGPNPTDTGTSTVKYDGPIYEVTIPIYVGCNLMSIPVHPIMDMDYRQLYGYYDDSYPTMANNDGIPMDLLFSHTSAMDTIEAIFWYQDGTWYYYVPGVIDATAFLNAGVGYWIKAEKTCSLEISGVLMENGPFTPPTIELEEQSWSLVGVTSVTGISLDDYLESTMGSTMIKAAGPVWIYYAWLAAQNSPAWFRNPTSVWPGEAFWVYNKVPYDMYIAP